MKSFFDQNQAMADSDNKSVTKKCISGADKGFDGVGELSKVC